MQASQLVSRIHQVEVKLAGSKDKQQGDKETPILTYLTAEISSDGFSFDLMLKQMDHSDAYQISLSA